MRAYKRFDKRGFTLVELMIVVAIIGVLAALAIYGVRRYLATAKTSEAKNTIGAISSGAQASYERETVDSQLVLEGQASNAASHALCGTATLTVPAGGVAVVPGKKYQPSSAVGVDYNAGDASNGWRCLKFTMNSPSYYVYGYTKAGNLAPGNPAPAAGAESFEASAEGDLDGDATTYSWFARTGVVTPATKTIRLASQVYVLNEFD
jgi:type IV pilus assembly protein PilA